MSKMPYIFFVFCGFFVSAIAQNPNRLFEEVREIPQGIEVVVNDGRYRFEFYTSEIIETAFFPKGQSYDESSHAVVMTPYDVKTALTQTSTNIVFKSDGLSVNIQKQPFQVSYWYNGNQVISEKSGYYKTQTHETLQFNLTDEEVLYGGGARALDMNRRGHKLELYNRAHYGYETESELMNYTMPLVLSSKKYMIHFDNAPIGFLDLDSDDDNTLTYGTISGRKTYQVVVGDSWERLIDNYTDLTGKQPMPPRWALGNFSSRFGYHSQAETEYTVGQFEKEGIPLDAVILDLYWFGKDIQGTMGNLEVFRDSFPDMEGMIARFKQQGVKTILITEPFVLTTSNRWEEAVQKNVLAKDSLGNPFKYDFYFGNTGLIDIYSPQGKDWFWSIYRDIADMGVEGIWGDLGEPEVHPTSLLHFTGSADEVHNIYGHDWAALVHEGYAKDFPNKRPFVLMRAGYSGSQRYGMIPWSGDVNRTWGGLQSQPKIAMQMGMQGLGYMHSDLGGFAGPNLDDELYTRWLQYGVFQPVYRPHAQEEVPSEPVFRTEKTKSLAKKSIELRYQMLPYNYNLAFQNHSKGTPLMRPLFFEEDQNDLSEWSSSYYWGHDFMVTPVTTSELKEVEIYFPSSSNWFDFYTDEKVEGGQTKTITTNETSIPTFVRSGAFVPMVRAFQSTDQYTLTRFDLHYYHDPKVTSSERSLYNDNGETKSAFEKGQFEVLEFEYSVSKRFSKFEFEAQIGENFDSGIKEIKLIIHHWEQEPARVTVNGQKILNTSYDAQNKRLSIPIQWSTSKQLNLKIKQ